MKIYSASSRKQRDANSVDYDAKVKALNKEERDNKASIKEVCKNAQTELSNKYKDLNFRVFFSQSEGTYAIQVSCGKYELFLAPLKPDLSMIGNYTANAIIMDKSNYGRLPTEDMPKVSKLYEFSQVDLKYLFKGASSKGKRSYQQDRNKLSREKAVQILQKYKGKGVWIKVEDYWDSFITMDENGKIRYREYYSDHEILSKKSYSIQRFINDYDGGIELNLNEIITDEELKRGEF